MLLTTMVHAFYRVTCICTNKNSRILMNACLLEGVGDVALTDVISVTDMPNTQMPIQHFLRI